MKILVVDDEPVVLNSCRKVLEEDGFDVRLVPSADEALKAIKDEEFDLLLVDVKMPKHDGMYLMQKVKEQWPDIPARLFRRRSNMKKQKALVIDDEQVVLDSVSKILTDENYKVDVSLSGREGLNWAIQKEYDIVLTDIRMPDIGGMRVLRDIKRANPSLPVVMITGYGSIQSSVQAMKLGAADYIEKPFTPDQLINAVASALDVAVTKPPEEQALIHKEEMITILERAASDSEFIAQLLYKGADALEEYNLTGPEKLALLTGDIEWIEKNIGPLKPNQKLWLEQRLSAEIW